MAVMRGRRRFTLEEYHRMGEAGILAFPDVPLPVRELLG
jgi:hypothetical protein